MAVPAESVAADPFAAMRALNRMTRAGFALSVRVDRLIVAPADRLTEQQAAYIRANKAALVALLMDAEILHEYLVQAGPAGLAFHEGTPADWGDARLLAAGEVLYADGRMVNRADRRFLREHAPSIPDTVPDTVPDFVPDTVPAPANVIPLDREAYEERAAIMEFDGGLPRNEAEQKALALAIRSAELQAAGWAPWNATARAESELLPEWESKP